MPNFVFVLIGIAVLAAIFFFLRSKKPESAEEEALEGEKPQKLPAKSAAQSARPQPEKAAPSPKEAVTKEPTRAEKADKSEKVEKAAKPAAIEPPQAPAKPNRFRQHPQKRLLRCKLPRRAAASFSITFGARRWRCCSVKRVQG